MKFSHSIMFHHFHGPLHPKRQGSITAEDFQAMLDYLDDRYNLLSAVDFKQRLLNNQIEDRDICLSFDDALKCQIDIAAPILKACNITAFFFVYSSPFLGGKDNLEIFSLFRATAFNSIDEFYLKFFSSLESDSALKKAEHACDAEGYLQSFPFYSRNDRIFRYIRDHILSPVMYDELNFSMMHEAGFDAIAAKENLWMNSTDLRTLAEAGHVIGLHSHSHPTKMSKLDFSEQLQEYTENARFLKSVVPENNLECMSHPCGDYNKDTLTALKELGIRVGFRSNMSNGTAKSTLEIPREDHANVIKEMKS